MKCHKCKQTLHRLMILAALEDAGAKCSPSANDCPEGGEHDFQERGDYPHEPAVYTMADYRRNSAE